MMSGKSQPSPGVGFRGGQWGLVPLPVFKTGGRPVGLRCVRFARPSARIHKIQAGRRHLACGQRLVASSVVYLSWYTVFVNKKSPACGRRLTRTWNSLGVERGNMKGDFDEAQEKREGFQSQRV